MCYWQKKQVRKRTKDKKCFIRKIIIANPEVAKYDLL